MDRIDTPPLADDVRDTEEPFFRAGLRDILDTRGRDARRRVEEGAPISPSYLSGILSGQRPGSVRMLNAIARTLGLTHSEIVLHGKRVLGTAPESLPVQDITAGEFQAVPKVKARLSAGGGSFETDSEVIGYYAFRTDFLRRKGNFRRMVLFDIAGNSMSPVLEHGDTVMVDQSQDQPISGHIYAIGVDDSVIVKRLEARPGLLILRSENPGSGDFEVQLHENVNIRIIGRVVWSAREY